MFAVTPEPIDPAACAELLDDPRAGAWVTFDGRVRNHHQGRSVTRLEYEAYEPLACSEGERILTEARDRFPILSAHCVHRVGRLEIGEIAVWIGVAAAHRGEAFAACAFVIDEIKARVPIWKKEYYAGGEARWVACHCAQPEAVGGGELR